MFGSVYEVWQDRRVPKLVIRKTAASRDEGRRQERSRRSASISRPRSRQPSRDPYGRPREQPSLRHPSQSQRGQQLRDPSPRFAPSYDDGYVYEDDFEGEDEELTEYSYVPVTEAPRGRRRDPVGASSAAPRPPHYYPPTASTHFSVSSQDGHGGRDNRGGAPESLRRDRERASHGRNSSQRGDVGSNAGVQQHRHPRSPQIFNLPSGQRPPPAKATTAAPAPAPRPGLHDLHSTTDSRPHYEHPDPGMATPHHAHAHASDTVTGLRHGEGNARTGYAGHETTEPPPSPRPSLSLRQRKREPSRSRAAPVPPLASRNAVSSDRNRPYSMTSGRSGMEGEATRDREQATKDKRDRRAGTLEAERLAAGMGYEQAYQAGLAEGRRSVRKGDNHEMGGEEGLSAARPKSKPDPVAHPHASGVSSHQQAPPPPPPPPPPIYHTRPRSFLGVPQQRQPPAHPAAAASHHPPPPPPPPSSAAPRPRIHKGIPTASNARDSLFGFSDQEKRDYRGNRRVDGLESASRNPYLDQAGCGQGSLKENYYTRAGEEDLTSSADVHPQLSSGQRRRPPAPPPSNLPGRSGSRFRPSREMPPQQQQRQRPTHPAAAYPPPPAAASLASDSSDVSSSSSTVQPRSRNPAATSRGNANAKVPSTGPRGGRVGAATTGPKPEPRLGAKREGAESVSGYGSARGREKTEVPRHPSLRSREPAIPQQQRRPAAAAAAPPASDCSDPSESSSSMIPRFRDPAATSHRNADAKVSSTGPRGGRVGVANTGPRPGPKSERANSVSGYGSTTGRERAKVPEPSSIKTGERATPQQRRRPTYPAAAAAAPPPVPPAHPAHPAPSSRNLRPSSSAAPRSPHESVRTNGTNTGPRTAVSARSTGPGPRTAPSLRRGGAESISGYGSTTGRERTKVPRPPSIQTGERTTPPQQRRPAPPSPRNLPPYSSLPSQSYNPLHTNGRAAAIGTRTTAPPPRRPNVRSVSVGGHEYRGGSRRPIPNYFPRPPSSPRWGEALSTLGSGRRRREEPERKPTLTQRIGYRLWKTALGCL